MILSEYSGGKAPVYIKGATTIAATTAISKANEASVGQKRRR
jgi:hypothetical protein